MHTIESGDPQRVWLRVSTIFLPYFLKKSNNLSQQEEEKRKCHRIKEKVLFDSEKKILGAQLQSRKEMFHLLDQLTIAVEEGWTFEQLEEHELFFQPEYRVPNMVWSKVANTAYED